MLMWAWLALLLGPVALFLVLSLVAMVRDRSGVLAGAYESLATGVDSEASDRAHGLMKDVFDEREYTQVTTRRFLDIHSPNIADRIYRIKWNGGLVSVYEHGVAVRELCLQPEMPLPRGDVMVLHKLMIEANESTYLATARHFPSLTPGERYRP
jgi:hypothetical protein